MKFESKNIKIPNDAKMVLDKLENAGFSAYVVGGLIRDQLRSEGTVPQDIDIATSAAPDEVERLFATSD